MTNDARSCCGPGPRIREIIERRAALGLKRGDPTETIRLLSATPWQREHQRYVRSELWRSTQAELGRADAESPDFLHEEISPVSGRIGGRTEEKGC
jgi:hypothetical protein